MIQSDWMSSHQLQTVLKSIGCDVIPNNDGLHVNVYNPKSEKVITINSNGKLPPFEVNMIFSTLGLRTI